MEEILANKARFHWREGLFLSHFETYEESMIFYLDPERTPRNEVIQLISGPYVAGKGKGGFIIDDVSDDPYTIILERKSPRETKSSNYQKCDRFDSRFILDSVRKQKLQNLNHYLIGESLFSQYDANLILLRRLKWSDLQKKNVTSIHRRSSRKSVPLESTPIRRNTFSGTTEATVAKTKDKQRSEPSYSPLGSDEWTTEDAEDGEESDRLDLPSSISSISVDRELSPIEVATCSQTSSVPKAGGTKVSPRKQPSLSPPGSVISPFTSDCDSISENDVYPLDSKRPIRSEYTEIEKMQILKYIKENDFYLYTHGNKIWKYLEHLKILPRRKFHSLREHFLKQMLPKLKSLKLPEEEIKKFQDAERAIRRNKHIVEAPIDTKRMIIKK